MYISGESWKVKEQSEWVCLATMLSSGLNSSFGINVWWTYDWTDLALVGTHSLPQDEHVSRKQLPWSSANCDRGIPDRKCSPSIFCPREVQSVKDLHLLSHLEKPIDRKSSHPIYKSWWNPLNMRKIMLQTDRRSVLQQIFLPEIEHCTR
jgi:hypothetical protein